MADSVGPTMQTEVQRPANTSLSLPMRLTSLMTFASSQVFIDVRSIIFWRPKASTISSNIGPEKLFSATVVRIVGTLKPAAACEISAALVRKFTASIDLVAKDICDWKSIRISAWLLGLSRVFPGVGLAVFGMMAPWVGSTRGRRQWAFRTMANDRLAHALVLAPGRRKVVASPMLATMTAHA